jgi:hypothetical protein
MHVVHTAAVPPNHGRICLAISGWTRKIRNADSVMTSAKCMGMDSVVAARDKGGVSRPGILVVLIRLERAVATGTIANAAGIGKPHGAVRGTSHGRRRSPTLLPLNHVPAARNELRHAH